MIPYWIECSFLIPIFFFNMKKRIEDNARAGWQLIWANRAITVYRKRPPVELRAKVVLFAPEMLKGIHKED